jgi:glycosyltransferase involved in cell wall biosynthesis
MWLEPRNVLSVIVPAYNEAATIEALLDRVLALGALLREVIVVDDGSKDGTAEIAQRVARRAPQVRVEAMPCNGGKTAAVRRGIELARGEIVIIQDADMEYDPAEIPEVISPILRGEADVVYGSRFLVRRAARVLYFYHFLANKFLTFCSNVLTNRNMTDIETCYKAMRRGVIQPLALGSKGFGMEVEITAMISKTNARTYETPISYYGRTYEEGKKIGMRDGLDALCYIVKYNLFTPRTRQGKAYIAAVNQYLASLRSEPAKAPATTAPAGPPIASPHWPDRAPSPSAAHDAYARTVD